MAALANKKHELFAQGIAAGKQNYEAYQDAGYSAKDSRVATAAASRLLAAVNIQARVMEIRNAVANKAIEASGITKAWVLSELADNVRRAKEKDENGKWEGSVANRALELLGKEKGMFVDRKEIGLRRLSDMTNAELLGLLDDLDGSAAGQSTAESIN